MDKELLDDMEGVEPVNVNAALLPVKVCEVKEGVEETVNAPDEIVKLVPVKSVKASPLMVKVSPVSNVNPPKAVIRPVEVKVDNLVSAREVDPETVKPLLNTPADVVVSDPPIPVLPVVVKVDNME